MSYTEANYENAVIQLMEQLGYMHVYGPDVERENTFTMEAFAESVNAFLTFRRYDILTDKGRVSRKDALKKAEAEYEIFNKTQKITSDFDKQIKQLLKNGGEA